MTAAERMRRYRLRHRSRINRTRRLRRTSIADAPAGRITGAFICGLTSESFGWRAMAVSTQRPHVPAQFLGQARLFRDKLQPGDDLAADQIQRIMAPLAARRRRSPIPREPALVTAAREWRALPAVGRLMLTIDTPKRGLAIREIRATAGGLQDSAWAPDAREPNVVLTDISLAVSPGALSLTVLPIGAVSLLLPWSWVWAASG